VNVVGTGGGWSVDGPSACVDEPEEDTSPVTAPVSYLLAAAVTAIGSFVLWLPGRELFHVTGYVLSTFVTLGLLAAFTRGDLRARQSPYYRSVGPAAGLRIGIAVLAVACAMAHVWALATLWSA
jgi:energy-coupling factor transporter transmembrane protein EcfT